MKDEFIPEGMITILKALEHISSCLPFERQESDIEFHSRAVSWIQNECYSGRLTAYLFLDGGFQIRISPYDFANTKKIEEMCRTGTYTEILLMLPHEGLAKTAPYHLAKIDPDGLTRRYSIKRRPSIDTLASTSGRVLFKRAELNRLLTTKATSGSSGSPSDLEEGGYCPPYIAFMLKGVEALQLSADERVPKKSITDWIRDNWPESLGRYTKHLAGHMATMMRQPSDGRGGNSSWKNQV